MLRVGGTLLRLAAPVRLVAAAPAASGPLRTLRVGLPAAGTRQFAPAYWHVDGAPEAKRTPPPAKPVKSDPNAGLVPAGQVFHELEKRMGAGKVAPVVQLHRLCSNIKTAEETRLLKSALKLYRGKRALTRESTATHVTKACFRANAADVALEIFSDRWTYAMFPSRHTLHLLIFRFAMEATTNPDAVDKAFASFDLLKLYNYEATRFARSLLIRACVNAGTPAALERAIGVYRLPDNTILAPVGDDLPHWTSRLINKINENAETKEQLLGKFSEVLSEWEQTSGQSLPDGVKTALSL